MRTEANLNWRIDTVKIMKSARHLRSHTMAKYARKVIRGIDYSGCSKGAIAAALAGKPPVLNTSGILKSVEEIVADLSATPCDFCKHLSEE